MLKWFRRAKKDVPATDAAETDLEPLPEAGANDSAEPEPDANLQPNDQKPAAIESTLVFSHEVAPEAETELEEELDPEPAGPPTKRGLFARLRDRLGKTKASIVDKVRAALRLHGKLDEELLEEIEMILIQSDVGVVTTQKIIERLRASWRGKGTLGADAVLAVFKQAIGEILIAYQRTLDVSAHQPTIILVVGVNGTGKTTTIGKLARQFTQTGKRVMLVAGDTFRAAAIEQLTIWAERTGSCIVRQDQGADPAAVVFEALEGAKADPPDVILIDTAGRLQTKTHLMEELRKIVRVIRKHHPEAPHETILVLDATTGQNALSQIKLFNEACELTGLVMSKLDGTAKGGILVACKDLYPLPIYKIGIGEGVEDLRDFEPHDFVEALFSASAGTGEEAEEE